MKYRALDKDGDYSFGKSMQNFLADAEAVAQAIKTNLLLLKAEWWEDLGSGLPLFQQILGPSTSGDRTSVADLLIKERISSTTGVKEIQSYLGTYSNRSYAVSCTVTTTLGSTATVEVTF